MKALDIVTIGHFSIDCIFLPQANVFKKALGGSPAYVSFSARQLGARVGVVSKVGVDFPKKYINMLKHGGVDLFGLKKEKNSATTSFNLEYSANKRRLILRSLAPPIRLTDISSDFNAESIHVAPIAGEFSSEIVVALRSRAKVLSLDPQGFLRRFDTKGKASMKNFKADKIFENVDVFKSSLSEVRVITGKSEKGLKATMKRLGDLGITVVIVTLGRKGAALFFDNKFCCIPSFPPKRLTDPTGAGDVFAGAFLAEYLRNADALWCACVGSAAASFKAETFGPVLFCTKGAIYERAKHLFAKVHTGSDAQCVIDAIGKGIKQKSD